MVKYCAANQCPINELACAIAASEGHLECLKYLREEAKAPWDWSTAAWAALNGHLHILEYLVERKYDQFCEDACAYAAENGHLRLFEVLARNRQSAVGRRSGTRSAREQTPNVYNTSSTITAHYQKVGDTNTECYASHKTEKQKKKTEYTRSV